VATFPEADTMAMPVTVTDAVDAVTELPLALTVAAAETVTEEVDTVAELPVTDTPAAAAIVTELTDAVDPGNASSASPQVLSPHAMLLEFQPCHATFASATSSTHYAILIIALLASAAGNVIVKSPAVEVLSPPKARTTTARSAVPAVVLLLKINAPFAVMVAELHVVSAKSVRAVVPLVVGSTFVREFPVAE
jgi:hypothetical protein